MLFRNLFGKRARRAETAGERRGASGVAYGLLVGLVAVGTVIAVRNVGGGVVDVFSAAGNRLGIVAASAGADGPCAGVAVGGTCDGGSIYLGGHPVLSGVEVLVAPTDSGSSVTWNDGGTNYPASEIWKVCDGGTGEACTDGRNGTEVLAPGDDGKYLAADGSSLGVPGTSGPKHRAAEACAGLSAAGSGEWHLPSPSVLDTIYARLVASGDPDNPISPSDFGSGAGNLDPSGTDGPAAGGFATGSGDFYWSVAEAAIGGDGEADEALATDFADGRMAGRVKDATGHVRCVRFLGG